MNHHQKKAAQSRNLKSVNTQQTAVLALHGRNQDPDFILNICDRLGWQHLPVLAPEAHEHSWYPGGFMDPVEDNQPHLEDALKAVDQSIQQLKDHGFKEEQIILLGFSQGACLASEYAIRNPRPYKALIFYTGGLIGDQLRQEYEGNFGGIPVFISTSETDDWVPVERVKESASVFSNCNANVRSVIYKDRPHEVCDDEIMQVREMIEAE